MLHAVPHLSDISLSGRYHEVQDTQKRKKVSKDNSRVQVAITRGHRKWFGCSSQQHWTESGCGRMRFFTVLLAGIYGVQTSGKQFPLLRVLELF
jgi:hypothetical protein